jgi:hypothetical protein
VRKTVEEEPHFSFWEKALHQAASSGTIRIPMSWFTACRSALTVRRLWRIGGWLCFGIVTLYVAAFATRVYVRKYYIFLPAYVRWSLTPVDQQSSGPTHVFFVFVDHFEPDHDDARANAWAKRYVQLASHHRDADGRPPQHTWFYPGEQQDEPILDTLHALTTAGLGEVELHLHHGYDNDASLTLKLRNAIAYFQNHGFLRTVDGATHFAFIHGNFGLDNSRGAAMCGVNDEIAILHQLGCFADFSFPSVYLNSQPSSVNGIYAIKDDPGPKSYDRVLPLAAIKRGEADLMMFEGPLLFAPSLKLRHLFLDLDDGNIHWTIPASPTRVDRWIRASVHVPGRPDWVFVKVWTHGISSAGEEDAAIGPSFDGALSYLEQHYNDGTHYVLHYVTAREAYNVAMAAVDGKRGDPTQYYDRTIPRYVACTTPPGELSVRDTVGK